MINYILSTLVFVSFSANAGTFIPEASGAAKVGDQIVIAGDEEPSSLWVSTPGTLLMEKVKVTGGKWDDLESLAALDSTRFFGMTSHSLTKKGKRRPEREQFMLFEKQNGKISLLKSFSLREMILAFLEKNFAAELNMDEVRNGTPDGGGLNVEGMAVVSGKLYFGLRSPLTTKGEAILLAVSDPETNPNISGAMKLNLSGNGMRGLDTSGEKLLILSGSKDDTDKEFGLQELHPQSAALNEVDFPGFSNLLRPESLVLNSIQSLVLIQDFEFEGSQDVIVELKRE